MIHGNCLHGNIRGWALDFGWSVGVLWETAVRCSRSVALRKMVKIVVQERSWGPPGAYQAGGRPQYGQPIRCLYQNILDTLFSFTVLLSWAYISRPTLRQPGLTPHSSRHPTPHQHQGRSCCGEMRPQEVNPVRGVPSSCLSVLDELS